MPVGLPDLHSLAEACAFPPEAILTPGESGARLFSIWEITTWHLPMAPEHLRRVLAAEPSLPQGSAGIEGGTRWFTAADLARLRAFFAKGPRGKRYRLARPEGALAPLITLAGPQGGSGRSLAVAHLATAAALNGWRVLVIDADPGGGLAALLGDRFRSETSPSDGPLALIARAAARHLRRMNAARLDLGDPPLPMDDRLSAALTVTADALIRPSRWPGLDLMAPSHGGLAADPQIAAWRMAQRSWQPWRVLAEALDEDGLRARYDLILCDTGRGLGPMALSALISADILLAPLPLLPQAAERLAEGLRALAEAVAQCQTEAQGLARALGQQGPVFGWQALAIQPTRAGGDGAQRLAGFAAKLGGGGPTLLPDALPEMDLSAGGQFYDHDYRQLGRLAYTPPREALEAAFRGLAGLVLAGWQGG